MNSDEAATAITAGLRDIDTAVCELDGRLREINATLERLIMAIARMTARPGGAEDLIG